jgi:D-alanine transaminase/branched-chain amino acid aminotransferase
MKPKYVVINDQLISEAEAKIHISDLSIQRGYGIFDFLKTINGKPIFIEDHFNRFFNSAKSLHLELAYDRTSLLEKVNELIQANDILNSGIKFTLTGGFSEDGYQMGKPNLLITQTPFEISKNNVDNGIKLVTYNHQRQLATVKTIDYLQAIRLQPYIKESGADDVLYHYNGSLRECPRANFFIVKGNEVLTPQTDILKGITRSKVLQLAGHNFTISERELTLDDLATATEAFITSSTKNILPVLAIDGKPIGNGNIGKITYQLHNQLNEIIQLTLATHPSVAD